MPDGVAVDRQRESVTAITVAAPGKLLDKFVCERCRRRHPVDQDIDGENTPEIVWIDHISAEARLTRTEKRSLQERRRPRICLYLAAGFHGDAASLHPAEKQRRDIRRVGIGGDDEIRALRIILSIRP